MDIKTKILFNKHLIYTNSLRVNEDKRRCSYLNAFLLINFGIEITNPEYVNDETFLIIDDVFHLQV